MKVSDLNPFIRYARIHKTGVTSRKEISKCYDCRVFFSIDANGFITINNRKYNISGSTAIYLPPATEYRFDMGKQGKIIVLDFDLINKYEHITNSLGTVIKDNFEEEQMPRYDLPYEFSRPMVKNIPQIKSMLVSCTQNFLHKETFYREHSSALLKICLIEFARYQENDIYTQLCEDVLAYIHKNYSDHTLTNERIAKEFNYHPFHLSRVIKKETGKTLHQYLIFHRLQIAKNYLLTTQYEVSQIAWRSGFSSSAYFIKLFHQNLHMTPKEYRKQQIHTEF